MIFDNIKNCKMYYDLNSNFEKAFAFIHKAMEEELEVGKYEIDGNDVYAIVQSYDSKLKENSTFEGHENYIDIQCVLEGCEILGVVDVEKAVIKDEYNPERDIAFYEDCDCASYCVAGQGDFCVFYPHDIHRPCIAVDNLPSKVRKIVVKIRI